MPPSRVSKNGDARWANLENILLGRTLHVQGLSPLHVPAQSAVSLHSVIDNDGQHQLTSADLDRMAEQMFRFLTLRINNIVLDSNGGEEGRDARGVGGQIAMQNFGQGFVRRVRSAFLEVPEDDDEENDYVEQRKRSNLRPEIMDADQESAANMPPPFAIEIEVQPSNEGVINPYANYASKSGRSRSSTRQYAHLLFLSSSKRASPTHYPLLLWKAPPSNTFGSAATGVLLPTQDQQQQQSTSNGTDLDATVLTSAQPTLTARVLIAHALDFLSRYFDCNLSQQAPLSSLRAAHLERTVEAIVQYHGRLAAKQSRLERDEYSDLDVDKFAIDVGYALPNQLKSDIDFNAHPRPGPAPDLNLISLTVPAEIVQELLRDADRALPFLPALQHYLASVTSLQLSRLTLVRVGIANIYLGAPTNATLAGTQLGQASAEIRLKIMPLLSKDRVKRSKKDGRRTSPDRNAPSPLETQRIAMVVRSLIRMAELDDW